MILTFGDFGKHAGIVDQNVDLAKRIRRQSDAGLGVYFIREITEK
jgi:hypothetical protein